MSNIKTPAQYLMMAHSKFALKIIIIAVLVLPVRTVPSGFSWQSQCEDIAARGHINILTINILFSELSNRAERLETIASFVSQEADADEPVDVILLQETVSGPLAGTINSSLELRNLLAVRRIDYNVRFRSVAGVRGAFMVGNALLSRCEVTSFFSYILPFVPETVADIPFPVRHEVQMARIDIPGYEPIDVYNTHLCSFCPGSDRLKQATAMMLFLEFIEGFMGAGHPVILGGDFNTDLRVSDNLPVYELIVDDYRFMDTYATVHGCTDCCSELQGYTGCTYAVDENPLALGAPPMRIDYIFAKGSNIVIIDSRVVFTSPPWVSDHSGVLSRIELH